MINKNNDGVAEVIIGYILVALLVLNIIISLIFDIEFSEDDNYIVLSAIILLTTGKILIELQKIKDKIC